MSLQGFKLPDPDTRIIKHNETLYKFKFQFKNVSLGSNQLPCDEETMQTELQEVIRVIIKTPNKLQPMKTNHFLVFPSKRPWKTATKLEFLANGKKLEVSPDVFHVCLTENANEPEARQAKETETQENTNDVGTSVAETTKLTSTSKQQKVVKMTKPKIKTVQLKDHHKANVQTRMSSNTPRYALRKRPAPNDSRSQVPDSKRAKRLLYRKPGQIKELRSTQQSDISPPAATGADADGVTPGEPEGGVVLPSKRQSRDDIQQNVLNEMVRLQNLARPSHIPEVGKHDGVRTGVTTRSQSKGVFQSVWDIITTPAKMLMRGKK